VSKAAHRESGFEAGRGTPRPFGRKPLRTFALVIALPTLLCYVISIVLVIGALAWMAREMDRIEDRRGVTAMHSALDGYLSGLGDAVSDEGTWNEAYLNVVVGPDLAWMDTTWGATARLGTAYDTVIVTDTAGTIVFGEDSVGAITGNISARFPSAKTMLDDLDKGIAATGDATAVTGYASDSAGTVGLAAISVHKTTPGEINVPRHLRRILWVARHITPTVLQDVAVQYQAPLPELVTAIDPDSSAIELRDADGGLAGTIAWTPDRPGEPAFRNAVLVATGIFFVFGLVLVGGLGVLRRTILRRAAAVEAALAAGPDAGAPVPATALREASAVVGAADIDDVSPIDGVTATSFEVAYQPVFDLRAETMVGVEGLLRWHGSVEGTVTQEELRPADLTLLLERVGILALRHASGELAPLLGMSLGLSATPAQLQSGVFAEKVSATLRATNLPASRLQLSVDTTLLPPIDRLQPSIAALRMAGVSLCLANFSLSPASIPYLRAGLIERVRLSPQLTANLGDDAIRLSLLEATVGAARSAGLAVTAPAMKQRADIAPLLRLGVREFQGDVFAAPMNIATLTALILAPARKAG
jgi:EAL domain-containing protein (putative c-di-GMP-specific phosphodiesterase class I)